MEMTTVQAIKASIEHVEAVLLQREQVKMPVTHHYAPGVYVRQMDAPKDTFIIGHEHRGETLNIVLRGRARVFSGGEVREVKAGDIFKSGAGVRKMVLVLEDLSWLNVHPNPDDETDQAKLEARFIVKSAAFLEHERKELCLGQR